MRGRFVDRRGGWDCHGLPVEIEVEKRLGISGKPQIEAYGIAEFNALCRESVARLPRRVGAAHRADRLLDRHRAGLPHDGHRLHRERLVEPRRAPPPRPALPERQGRPLLPALRHGAVQPRGRPAATRRSTTPRSTCASRCATRPGESLLVWTTTPWTLPANQAAAVNPEVAYAAVEHEGETLILAEALVERVLGEGARIARRHRGRRPRRPALLPAVPLHRRAARGGRGRLRHDRGRHRDRPPRAGLRRGRHGRGAAARLPRAQPGRAGRPLHRGGRPLGRARGEGGRPRPRGRPRRARPAGARRDLPPPLPALLALRHAAPLLRQALVVHPHDGGQGAHARAQPRHRLAPRARARRALRAWLEGNVDWAISRDRYWGTPLPLWRCAECDRVDAVGSYAELRERVRADAPRGLRPPPALR